MSILLSIAAALSGLMIVGPLVSYTWAEMLLNQTLSNGAALLGFWNRRFGDSGGVMGLLLSENPNWPKPEYQYCRELIRAEYEAFRRLRRQALLTLVLFAALWTWAAYHFSRWILFWFVLCVLASATANRERGCWEALSNIFRAVRLWMWVDPASLEEDAGRLRITELISVLQEVETTENSANRTAGGFP